jgi:hypothetical protein
MEEVQSALDFDMEDKYRFFIIPPIEQTITNNASKVKGIVQPEKGVSRGVPFEPSQPRTKLTKFFRSISRAFLFKSQKTVSAFRVKKGVPRGITLVPILSHAASVSVTTGGISQPTSAIICEVKTVILNHSRPPLLWLNNTVS